MNTIQTEVFGLDSRITPFLQKFGRKSVSFLGEEIMQYNVIDYGAVADGEKLNTVAVQAAIDACAAAGGGQVFFPKGKYVLSTVFLKSNVHIVFEDATEILGSLNFTDYCPDETVDYPLYQDKSHSYFHCSMFVGIDCENIKLTGKAKIDMRSVWDEEDIRKNIAYRGAKCIALKNCKNVELSNLFIYFATDLAIYFAGCEDVEIYGIKMRTYIDGISPDNCKNVRIHDCDVEAGDDALVFKSSYTLNKLDICKNIRVWNCRLKSRAYCIKFGTETNGGFENIVIEDIYMYDTRICGFSIQSADGAIIDDIVLRNVKMVNVNVPIFIHLGKRMRGPEGREIGRIRNVLIENVEASGPYGPFEIIPCYYPYYKANDWWQDRKVYSTYWGTPEMSQSREDWQTTSNVCGLKGIPLENITFRNVHLSLDGGVQEFERNVKEEPPDYPQTFGYGWILPAKGIYFRYIDGLVLDNVTVKTERPDVREDFIFDNVENLKV